MLMGMGVPEKENGLPIFYLIRLATHLIQLLTPLAITGIHLKPVVLFGVQVAFV